MLSKDKEDQLIHLFITVDDFCIALDSWKQTQVRYQRSVTREPLMSDSEMMTILLFYQYSGYKHSMPDTFNTITKKWWSMR